jgi:hypothetical protein
MLVPIAGKKEVAAKRSAAQAVAELWLADLDVLLVGDRQTCEFPVLKEGYHGFRTIG